MPPRPALTEEDKGLLTDEELAGYEDDTLVDEGEDDPDDAADEQATSEAAEAAAKAADELKRKEEAAAEDPEEDPAAEDDAAKKAAGDEAARKAAEDAAKPAEKKADPGAADAPQVKAERMLPDWKAPENAEARLKEIDTQLDAIATQFDDGELSATEHRAKVRELEQERRQIDKALLKAEIATETTADAIQQATDTWYNDTVPAFLTKYPEYEAKPALMGALDTMVKKLQSAQPDKQFDPRILDRADKAVREELGLPPRQGADPSPKPRPRPELPPTLAHVPAADVTDPADGSEFAQLDRLEGEQYEAALARLSDEQRDRYLSSR